MKLVHSKEYKVANGTYVEEDEEHKNQRTYKMKLNNFIRSQKSIIDKVMESNNSLFDFSRDSYDKTKYYSILYSHKYLLELCGIKYEFNEKLNNTHIKDFSFINKSDIKWYSEIPKEQFCNKFLKIT